MDFDKAINAHVQWKMKLAAYLTKPDRSLDAAVVGADNSCELGKWIRGDGQTLAKTPDFVKLVADHTQFHKAAGDIIRKADSGQKMTEVVALGAKSDYSAASNAVVASLMTMKRHK